jgi:hypothetical protein
MKSILALILGVILLAFTADSIAKEWGYYAKDKEELYGTWINLDYKNIRSAKIVWKPDGTTDTFKSANLEKSSYTGRYLITGKWTDSESNIWYRTHWVLDTNMEGYSLIKISNSGQTLEYVYDTKPPTEIDSKDNLYRTYTRE